MKKTTFMLGLGIALACSPLLAAPTPDQSPSFQNALVAALANHPIIQGRQSDKSAAKADKEGAEWARYPSASFEASSGKDANAGLFRLDQPLWTGGRITADIQAADHRLNASDAAISEAKREITLRVIAAYTEATRQKMRVQVARTGVQEHEKLLAMIQRRVGQDVSSQADQRLASSRLLQARNDLSLTEQALQNALTQLTQLTGNPVTDVQTEGLESINLPQSLEAAQQQALDSAPTLLRLVSEEEAANAGIESRRSVYLPQVLLRLEHGIGGDSTTDSRALIVLQAQPGAGLSSISGVDAAIARRNSVRLSRQAAERDIKERIAIDWNDWNAARSRLDDARQASDISDEVFSSYTRQYVVGRKTWIDVLNAVREVTQARYNQEDARILALAAALRIETQTGMLKAE